MINDVICVAAFVRYALISDVKLAQWQANQLCVDRGYDGLAIIDSPLKWDFAQALLTYSHLP